MLNLSLPENFKIVRALKPATDAAGRTGTRVSLKGAHKLFVVASIDQGNAATIALTLEQSTNVAGAGAKAVSAVVPIWANTDLSVNDTLTRQTDAASFTTDAGLKEKLVVFEVRPEVLDIAGGFDCVAIKTGASNVANLTQALYVLVPRYQQAAVPSAITD
jgi:hypothetical protein